jgi:putative tricarboxylic transport membrane protein
VFVERPISAVFIGLCVLLIALQVYVRLKPKKKEVGATPAIFESAE